MTNLFAFTRFTSRFSSRTWHSANGPYFNNLANSNDPRAIHKADVKISKDPLLHANHAEHHSACISRRRFPRIELALLPGAVWSAPVSPHF